MSTSTSRRVGASGTDAPPAPRRQLRARSQRLLITLFGDYWDPERPPIPSAGLVRVLGEFAITPANARAALSRLAKRDLLVRTKQGRRTSYGVSDDAWKLLVRGARRIFADAADPPWDGTWTLVSFSLPNEDGDQRRLLRARLRWLTFWPLYDGNWVTPHDRLEVAREQLRNLGISDALVVRTRDVDLLPATADRLEDIWDVPALTERYERFLADHAELEARCQDRAPDPATALVVRTELVDEWRRMVRDDPDLPAELLPGPFPRPAARARFLRIYRALEQPARRRFDELAWADPSEAG